MTPKPMEWEIWGLGLVSDLPGDPDQRLAADGVLASIEKQEPMANPVLMLRWGDGGWEPAGRWHAWLVNAVKALASGSLHVELGQHSRGGILSEARLTSVVSSALADKEVRLREERRLERVGHGDLVEVLRHYHQRWADYRIPVWRLPPN